jgi:hypothetical protein
MARIALRGGRVEWNICPEIRNVPIIDGVGRIDQALASMASGTHPH